MRLLNNRKYLTEVILHSIRVSWYSLKIGFGSLSFKELITVAIAALLHDIGKLNIRQEILFKPEKLTFYEKVIIENHSETGYNAISKILKQNFLMIQYLVKNHHSQEFFQNKMLLVLILADKYDALRSKRSYKEGISSENAIQIILGEVTGVGENQNFLLKLRNKGGVKA